MQIRMGIALSNCNIHYKYILLIIPDITVVLRSLTKLNYLLKTVLAKLSDWNQPNGQSMFSLIQVHLPILQFTQVRLFSALVLQVAYFSFFNDNWLGILFSFFLEIQFSLLSLSGEAKLEFTVYISFSL